VKKLMENVMTDLQKKHAEGDLIFSSNKSLKMSSQKEMISEYKVSSSQILGLRVIKDGKVGISYTEAMDEESLNLMLLQALSNAENSNTNQHESIIDIKGELLDYATYDENQVDLKIKTQKSIELESKVKALDSRVIAVPYNSFSEYDSNLIYLSSKGRFTGFSDKVYSITSSALMEDKGKKSNFYDYQLAHKFCDLNFDKVIETSLFHANHLLGESPLKTGKYTIYFSEDCLKNIFECFSNLFSAKSAMDKMNPWSDRLGDMVISKEISIQDIPDYPKAFRKSLFDSEGVQQKTLQLIQDGVLNSFYHNSVTAKLFNKTTTGHATRGPTSSIGISGTHIVISGKNPKSLPDIYFEVIQMDGLFSSANRVTGNFSVAVKGYLWQEGKRVQVVGSCTLSGNFMEMFKHLSVCGNDLRSSTDFSFFTVPICFHDLSVAGI
jgi:PmbA protein